MNKIFERFTMKLEHGERDRFSLDPSADDRSLYFSLVFDSVDKPSAFCRIWDVDLTYSEVFDFRYL